MKAALITGRPIYFARLKALALDVVKTARKPKSQVME
jgi:hypothetical protein